MKEKSDASIDSSEAEQDVSFMNMMCINDCDLNSYVIINVNF